MMMRLRLRRLYGGQCRQLLQRHGAQTCEIAQAEETNKTRLKSTFYDRALKFTQCRDADAAADSEGEGEGDGDGDGDVDADADVDSGSNKTRTMCCYAVVIRDQNAPHTHAHPVNSVSD